MLVYRAYLLDKKGKIVWGDWIEAADQRDAEAKAHALCKEGTPLVELWKGNQRIAELPCDMPLPPLGKPSPA